QLLPGRASKNLPGRYCLVRPRPSCRSGGACRGTEDAQANRGHRRLRLSGPALGRRPTAANAEYYARIVRDKAIIRHLIHSSNEILRDAYDQAMPADELLESAERKVLDIAEMGITGQTFTL